MKERTIRHMNDYDCLSGVISPFRSVDAKMELVDVTARVWSVDAEALHMIYALIHVEDEIDRDTKRNLNGLIEKETAARLVECLKFFGVWFHDDEHEVKYLEWDATGVYGEHSSFTVFYKRGSYFCESCGVQVPDFEAKCEGCKRKKVVDGFDPTI